MDIQNDINESHARAMRVSSKRQINIRQFDDMKLFNKYFKAGS